MNAKDKLLLTLSIAISEKAWHEEEYSGSMSTWCVFCGAHSTISYKRAPYTHHQDCPALLAEELLKKAGVKVSKGKNESDTCQNCLFYSIQTGQPYCAKQDAYIVLTNTCAYYFDVSNKPIDNFDFAALLVSIPKIHIPKKK